ncbi:MAG: DUF3795 domain-containing protein [Dehalococcoidia bacterium]
MNCAICSRYLAFKHDVRSKGIRMSYCAGCRPRDRKCALIKKKCPPLLNGQIKYCYECQDFPCNNLHHLDQRYKTFFRMSMVENLLFIKVHGVKQFIRAEENKWKCPECGQALCCHNGICFACGSSKLKDRKDKYQWEDE